MKKLISILLIVVLSITLISCAAKEKEPEESNYQPDVSDTAETEDSEDTEANDEIISVTVDIFDPETATSELTDDEKAAGFVSKTIDGEKATYTIKQSDFDKYLNSLDEMVRGYFDKEILNDTDYPGITKVDYNADLTNIVIHIDNNTFDTINAFAVRAIVSIIAFQYQQWNGIEGETSVTIVDEAGNEIG